MRTCIITAFLMLTSGLSINARLKTADFGGMKFIYVKGGYFNMDSRRLSADESPVHRVCLNGFWIGKYEVTQEQYTSLMGNNPSTFKNNPDNPVENVNWYQALKFAETFKRKYSKNADLPAEAQWEYAARAGTTTAYFYGNDNTLGEAQKYGVLCGDELKTQPVGSKKPNPWVINGIIGNVWEWCLDWYDKTYYSRSPVRNPINKNPGKSKVIRGSAFSWEAGCFPIPSSLRYRIEPWLLMC